jgi:hypothetical protein
VKVLRLAGKGDYPDRFVKSYSQRIMDELLQGRDYMQLDVPKDTILIAVDSNVRTSQTYAS